MPAIETFLKAAFPNVPGELAAAAAAELAGGANGAGQGISREAYDEAVEETVMCREEIARLQTELVRHKDGVLNATKAGLDTLGERARQRRLEGYDDAHDDSHDDFSLSAAAIAYVMDARLKATTGKNFDSRPPAEWPWSPLDWKPKSVRQSLVVAAALLIAEIERCDRSGAHSR